MGAGRTLWFLLPQQLRELPADLGAIVLLTISAGFATFLPVVSGSLLQVGLGFLFVIVAPGYALVAALFPEANWQDGGEDSGIDGVTRVAFAATLSIALVSIVGLVLNVTPLGVRRWSVVGCLMGVTLILVAIGVQRRHALPTDRRYRVGYRSWWSSARDTLLVTRSTREKVLSILAVFTVVLAVGTVGYVVAFPKQGQTFTEFYLLNESTNGELTADTYPQNLTVGETRSVVMGVENHERRYTEYTIVVQLQNVSSTNNSVISNRELDRFDVPLSNNETWRESYTMTSAMTGEYQRFVWLLYKEDPPQDPSIENAYRSLRLWVSVEQ